MLHVTLARGLRSDIDSIFGYNPFCAQMRAGCACGARVERISAHQRAPSELVRSAGQPAPEGDIT
jgi:hypothetical protein